MTPIFGLKSRGYRPAKTIGEVRRRIAAATYAILRWGDRRLMGVGEVRRRIAAATYAILRWGDRQPMGVRSIIGVVFMIGGVFGFLPILGFWLLPLGAAFIALDIPWTCHRIHDWMLVLKARSEAKPRP